MKKEYENFVEYLRQAMMTALGMDENQIFFAQGEKGTPFEEDKLFIQCAKQGEACELCGMHTQDAYKKYKEGVSLDEIVGGMVQAIGRIEEAGYLGKVLEAADYEKARDKLFIRLVNIEKNKLELRNAIYKSIGDIALVLYLRVEETKERLTSIKIRKEFVEGWKQDREQVFADALLNTYYLAPPRIYRWEELIYDLEYEGDNFMDVLAQCELRKDAMGNCLSTTKRTNGAVAVFLPGVAQRLAYLLGGSFYMVFTSIHEVMIHIDTMVDPKDLQHVLQNTIEEATPAEDVLTCKIYHYNKDTECFTCV